MLSQEYMDNLTDEFSFLIDDDGDCIVIEVVNGWFKVIRDMCKEIKDYIDASEENFSDFKIEEIEWDDGRLRVWTENGNKDIEKIIEKYEDLSEVTCEECGSDGYKRDSGLNENIVLCDDCCS